MTQPHQLNTNELLFDKAGLSDQLFNIKREVLFYYTFRFELLCVKQMETNVMVDDYVSGISDKCTDAKYILIIIILFYGA